MSEIYSKVVSAFGRAMIKELEANHDKGGRHGEEGWLNCNNKFLLAEIYYHTGKLQQALKENDIELIKEFSADVANLALMVYDKHELLVKEPIEDNTRYDITLMEQLTQAKAENEHQRKEYVRWKEINDEYIAGLLKQIDELKQLPHTANLFRT